MTEETKKKPRGFASMIYKTVMPLNDNEKFKEKYKDIKSKILLNAVDGKYAALVIIDNGTVDVEGIVNKEKNDLKQDVLGWEAKLETTTELFLKLASGQLGTGASLVKIITRKLKIKGMNKILDLFALLEPDNA
jgi:uncharacterized membrane protein YkoI